MDTIFVSSEMAWGILMKLSGKMWLMLIFRVQTKHIAIAKCEISFYYSCDTKYFAKHEKTCVNSIYIVGIIFVN